MKNIVIIKNFLSPIECDTLLNKFKSEVKLSTAGVGGLYTITNARKSSVGFIPKIDLIDERIKNIMRNEFKLKGYEISGLGPYQFTEYKIGEYFNWHKDASEEYKERYCSIVIQLNDKDDYTGGILEIQSKDNDIQKMPVGKGNMFIFHSDMLHRVSPVVSGIRYSLVNWVSVNKLLNIQKTLI